jgi:hypothetical protein
MMIASHSPRNAQQRFCMHHRNPLEFVAPIRRYYHTLPEPLQQTKSKYTLYKADWRHFHPGSAAFAVGSKIRAQIPAT